MAPLEEIMANLRAASDQAIELVRRFLHHVAADPTPLLACPARDALKLAIWTNKSRIAAEEIQRLSPLWGRYFS
jgi:5'-methylthioadenosine phosphorylase